MKIRTASEVLVAHMRDNNVTLSEMARLLNETRQRVYDYKNERRAIPPHKAFLWASILGCKPEELSAKLVR